MNKEMLEAQLEELRKYLKYADGKAYYQDKQKIKRIEERLSKLSKSLARG